MTRERLVWVLALLGLVLGGWWLRLNTEWVEVDSPRAAQGEARDNPVYAAQQLLRRLDLQVERHESLAAMPPPQARLVLLSSDWSLVPERAGQLHRWVQGGGHLVLMDHDDWKDTALAGWVPVSAAYVRSTERAGPPRADAPASAPRGAGDRTTLSSTPPLWGDTEMLASCDLFHPGWQLRTRPGQEVAWTLARVDGTPATQDVLARQSQALQTPAARPAPQAVRVPLGAGSVTVVNTSARLFFNGPALRCDHPLLLAAAVQAEPGATVWIYLQEKREALLPWLWHSGWIAIVAGALALAAALWRGAVRFGPQLAPAPRLRRSISEQVHGLGAYLQGGGREALLAAQQRALHEVAQRKLAGYARLPAAERARAIAQATGLPPLELATALAMRFCARAQLPAYLQLLETARRRLHGTPDERHPPS